MQDIHATKSTCRSLSLLAVFAGAVGMVVSFYYLASSNFADITAGTSGFVAGAILIGSGLIALAMLVQSRERAGLPQSS
jgi:hypothetical protein